MIALKCKKCGVIGSCICNFTKYELTKEEKDKLDKALEEMNNQPIQFLSTWHTNKVIDFVNWYIELKGLGENNKLENQSIVDSFLRGEKVEVWKEVNTEFKEQCFTKPQEQKFISNYIFKLDKVEEDNLMKYLNKLKKKYGSYGFLTYEFTPTGICTVVKVKSSHKKKSKDITNLDSF
jgi:hypothetical protein